MGYDTPVAASVNRTRIVDIPGVDVDSAVRGRQAYHLLSAPALIRYAQEAADALQLPDVYRDADPSAPEVRRALPRHVDACLHAEESSVRDAAESIARRLGRNLGHLVVALYQGDRVNREARADWPDAAWEVWHAIRAYKLGGGVMSGDLGDRLIRYADEFLAETGYDGALSVATTPRPWHMGILGVARTIPSVAREATPLRALCLDLGQTSVKRARIRYENGVLVGLRWLPSVPVRWQWRNRPDAGQGIDPEAVLAFTAHTLAEGIELARAQSQLCEAVGMSIAAYVRGRKLLGHGLYARMHTLSDDVPSLIASAVACETGSPIRPILIHDGTASALLHAGETATAVLVIGTAIGVGFPPDSKTGLCPLASDLHVGKR